MFFKNVVIIFLSCFFINSVYCWDSTDFYQEATSPARDQSARIVGVTGLSLLTLALVFEDSIIDPAQQEVTEKDNLGSWQRPIEMTGEVIPNALYTLGMLGDYYFSKDKERSKSLESAEVMFKATSYASLLTTILKYTIRQKRPSGNHRNSFPSGHTTTIFAFASVVADRHPWYVGVPSYLMAGLLGFQRMNGNRHYLHDVIAGATIGAAFGIGMNRLIESRNENKELNVTVVPFAHDNIGLCLNYRF